MKVRNCAWDGIDAPEPARPVWARGQVVCTQCPKSLITAESLSYLEVFLSWKAAGGGSVLLMDAKSADAILALEEEWQRENKDGEKK